MACMRFPLRPCPCTSSDTTRSCFLAESKLSSEVPSLTVRSNGWPQFYLYTPEGPPEISPLKSGQFLLCLLKLEFRLCLDGFGVSGQLFLLSWPRQRSRKYSALRSFCQADACQQCLRPPVSRETAAYLAVWAVLLGGGGHLGHFLPDLTRERVQKSTPLINYKE